MNTAQTDPSTELGRKQAVDEARLIAAAPDLLEAAKAILGEYLAMNVIFRSVGRGRPKADDMLRAAIAKAEGRE